MNVPTIMEDAHRPDHGAGNLHPHLQAFLAAADKSTLAVDRFLSGISSPLIEPGALTFLWRGDAHSVEILRWINAGVDRQRFQRLPGSDLWFLRLPVKDGGRFEYKLNVVGDHGEAWILDPANQHRAGDPFGENSVAMTFGYARPEWSLNRGAPRGHMEEITVDSAVFEHARNERIYLPNTYDNGRDFPLVVIHDGGDYDEYADLSTSLDNLIDAGDIPPLVAVLIQADDRMSEYPQGRRHARYVVGELLPAVTNRYSISTRVQDRVLLGASLGAVASLATAFRFRGVFGGLILKSGSFVLDPEKLRQRSNPVFHRVARLVEVVRRAPAPEATRAFVSTGELEGLAGENKALAELLADRGIDVLFQSSWDGHHWHNWRDQLRDALMWVLPRQPRE
ncbi:alpha/beta hydrolase-fold protein [Tropicimonas aquimaris]|uniref:Alpha/beta hydrolase-fold protein n=1 Tax=Tropicimonas aquimaris TaxID=914152 RepID=A0ABW3ISU6_9RHOB